MEDDLYHFNNNDPDDVESDSSLTTATRHSKCHKHMFEIVYTLEEFPELDRTKPHKKPTPNAWEKKAMMKDKTTDDKDKQIAELTQ